MNRNPLFKRDPEAAREAGKLRWASKDARQEHAFKRRGFHVPPELEADYRELKKYYTAGEAGRMLGLI